MKAREPNSRPSRCHTQNMDSGTGSHLSKYTSIIGGVRLATSDASDTMNLCSGTTD